jgi:integrase
VHLFESTVTDQYHALWVLLGTAGLRLGEALGLHWSDIDWQHRTLTIRRALQRQTGRGLVFVEPKSKGSRRTIELLDIAVDALQAHRDRQRIERANPERFGLYEDRGIVFASPTGAPIEQGGVWKHWKRALEKAGLPPIRRHDLRHTAATLRLQTGANVKVVQELLGHSSVTLTLDTHSHVTPGMQRESADAVNRVLAGKMARQSG